MKSALALPSPGTGFVAVEYSGQRVHDATCVAISSSERSVPNSPPNSSPAGVPKERPGGTSATLRDSADADDVIPDGALCVDSAAIGFLVCTSSGLAPACRSARRQSVASPASEVSGARCAD